MTKTSTATKPTYDPAYLAHVFNREAVLNQNLGRAMSAQMLFAFKGYAPALYELAKLAKDLNAHAEMWRYTVEGVKQNHNGCIQLAAELLQMNITNADNLTAELKQRDISYVRSVTDANLSLKTKIKDARDIIADFSIHNETEYTYRLKQNLCDSVFPGLGWYTRSYPAAPAGQCGLKFQP